MIQKNPLSTHKNKEEKFVAYMTSVGNGEFAYKSNGTSVPLLTMTIDAVEFIGGLWRVQTPAHYKTTRIRDAEFIMGPRIDVMEKNYFEYYHIARPPVFNCYGPIAEPKFDMVAGHYILGDKEYWSYGKNIADARAFLSIAVYDDNRDLIHAAAGHNTKNHQR